MTDADVRVFGESVAFMLGPVPITATMLVSLAVSIALVGAALALRRAVRLVGADRLRR